MINFELAIVLGTELEEIRFKIENFESMYLGLFINSLCYKNQKEEKKKKDDFINSVTQNIKLINREIHELNTFIRCFNKFGILLTFVEKINLTAIKRIILAHQGNHPQAEGPESLLREFLGEGKSPSILARKHTSLQIQNVILRTKLSISDFVKSISRFLEVFDSINQENLRPRIQNEIEKAKSVYSIGLFGESIFILGRLLEDLVTEYIILFKKIGKVNLTKNQILNLGFHNKIEYLHSKNLSILSDSQFSKLMSIKWDRNIYGHKINSKNKDYQAVTTISLMMIDFINKKIVKLKQKLKK